MSTAIVETTAETTLSTFQEKTLGKTFALIYPRHRSHLALVAMFLQTYQHNLIYYPLKEHDATLFDLLTSLVNDENVFPAGTGSQTRAALDAEAKPPDLAAAFGADLGALRSDEFMLMLDALDYMDMDAAADRFFRALPDVLPSHVRIVINARLMDLQPWNDLVLSGDAAVVGNEEALDGGIYGGHEGLGQLEVLALSGGHVYIDGRPVTSWDGSLPRHLFYYFVDHPMVTRDEIFEIFWPKMAVKEATNVFHVTKRKISERLGYELTNYSNGFYIPSVRLDVHYDARVFENAVQEAIENEVNAPANWYQAVQLYRSDYLPYISMPWVEARREEMKHKYAQALIGLGRYHRGLNELDKSLGYLLRALREKPDWEDVHRDVMMIYFQQGKQDAAIAQYEQLTATLKRMFGIAPSKVTRDLLDVIKVV
jgi:DNA-binding SARP family transcriptional activator